jgi:hypothetical protein
MLDDTTKTVLNDVAEAATRIGQPGRRKWHELEVLAIFDRCRSTLDAAHLLAENGFGQEALALTRDLFSASLMLTEIASVDEPKRVELVVGWWLAGADDLTGAMVQAHADEEATAMQTGMRSASRKIEEYARSVGARPRRWRPDEKTLAIKHGRDGYLDFRIAHHFVHGSSFATAQRYAREGDVVLVGGLAAYAGWATPAVLFAASSLVHATSAVATILGWEQAAGLESLLERIESAGEEYEKRAAGGAA